MKFAMLGAGGLGGYFGARLAQAGHDVAFIARGAHLAAMRAGGLRIVSENGDAHIAPVVATDDPKTLGPVDCVIVAVKLWDLEAAAASAKPLIGARTAVVSFQNGIEKDDVLARIVGAEHVVGGVGYIAAKIAEPGVIEQTGRVARAVIGELDGTETERVTAIVQALTAAGIDTQASNAIKKATWEKFVFIVGLSGLTSLVRAPIGPIRENAEARSLLADAMHEVVNLGIAIGDRPGSRARRCAGAFLRHDPGTNARFDGGRSGTGTAARVAVAERRGRKTRAAIRRRHTGQRRHHAGARDLRKRCRSGTRSVVIGPNEIPARQVNRAEQPLVRHHYTARPSLRVERKGVYRLVRRRSEIAGRHAQCRRPG
jgi:2-dehydropantoate 2-reductase